PKSVLACDLKNWIHIARPPSQMHGDDGPRPRRKSSSNRLRGNVLRDPIHVGNHWARASHHRATRRRNKGSRTGNNFIAWADPNGIKRQFQSGSTVDHSNAALACGVSGKLFLEPAPLVTGPIIDLARSQDSGHYLHFLCPKGRPTGKRALLLTVFFTC